MKDKTDLTEVRKRIERQMERFKECEKEMKCKAFSKEGLQQQPKVDPREKERQGRIEWLNEQCAELSSRVRSPVLPGNVCIQWPPAHASAQALARRPSCAQLVNCLRLPDVDIEPSLYLLKSLTRRVGICRGVSA